MNWNRRIPVLPQFGAFTHSTSGTSAGIARLATLVFLLAGGQAALAQTPTVNANGVVDGASFGATVTAGSLASVFGCLLFGVPTAYVIVFGRLKNSNSLFFWFLSTTLLPPVAGIVPVFLLFRLTGLLDTLGGMVLVYTGINIPIVIWMTRSYLLDVPREVLESSDIDGSSRIRSFFSIIVPLARQGIISTGLLVFIFVWNEFFFSINLTYVNAAPVPVYMASFMTQEGLFWAKLSAISTLVVLPPLILGWFAQRSLVKGLTMGAVKG